jgi:sulfoxide reductase catalytic subunit YedY
MLCAKVPRYRANIARAEHPRRTAQAQQGKAMSKFYKSNIQSSAITPESVYLARQRFSRRGVLRLGAAGLGAAALTACSNATPVPVPTPAQVPSTQNNQPAQDPTQPPVAQTSTDEFGDKLNTWEQITRYNNYYEFSTDKEEVAVLAMSYVPPTPFKVEVGGLVDKPITFDLDDLKKKFVQEERVYRLRCVEGWSMVIPWTGFSLAALVKAVSPSAQAQYVKFSTYIDAKQMPGDSLPWPYVEGLRLDEAMNDLALMVTGLYGKPLPNQNGAPLRLAVPWKYGFKSIKGISKIEFVEQQPVSTWTAANGEEYGFYSNVNPQRPHPRWSQATERRIGESGRRPTRMYNGHEGQVAGLYAGMDLMEHY